MATLQTPKECLFIVDEISYPCVTELSNTEAENQKEEVQNAASAGGASQEMQTRTRKKKAQATKHVEGECFFLTVNLTVPFKTCYLWNIDCTRNLFSFSVILRNR